MNSTESVKRGAEALVLLATDVVLEGPSPWKLRDLDKALIRGLLRNTPDDLVDAVFADLADWVEQARQFDEADDTSGADAARYTLESLARTAIEADEGLVRYPTGVACTGCRYCEAERRRVEAFDRDVEQSLTLVNDREPVRLVAVR